MEKKLDYKKTKKFWEGRGEKVSDSYSSLQSVTNVKSIMGAEYRDKTEKKLLYSIVPFNKDLVVLDLGCGTGRWTLDIAKKVKQVVGIDFAESLLDIARKDAKKQGLKNVVFVETSLNDYPYDKQFDIVYAGSVFQYLEDKELEEVLGSIKKCLTKEGFFITRDTLTSKEQPVRKTGDYHVIFRNQKKFIEQIENKGFTLIYSGYTRGVDIMSELDAKFSFLTTKKFYLLNKIGYETQLLLNTPLKLVKHIKIIINKRNIYKQSTAHRFNIFKHKDGL